VLNWLLSLLKPRNDRELFVYWDGQKQRRIDPLVAWRRMMADPECNFAQDFQVAMNPAKKDGTPFYPDALVDEAEQRLLRLTRETFDVTAWAENEAGLTVAETIDLLGDFLRFRVELKKKRSTSPTLSPSLDSTEQPTVSATDPAESPPNTESGSNSTRSESAAEAPIG
jgi:hypothetical protein